MDVALENLQNLHGESSPADGPHALYLNIPDGFIADLHLLLELVQKSDGLLLIRDVLDNNL